MTHSRYWPQAHPPFSCYFNCGRELVSKSDRSAIEGWEWFTGYGDGPIHFCPQCRRTRQFEIDRIREKANVKPPGYPDNRIELVPPKARDGR